MKRTRARQAVDRAAKACGKAHDALRELGEFIPERQHDAYLARLRELREWSDYLEQCRWPDKVD